jgi:hypothetical protein
VIRCNYLEWAFVKTKRVLLTHVHSLLVERAFIKGPNTNGAVCVVSPKDGIWLTLAKIDSSKGSPQPVLSHISIRNPNTVVDLSTSSVSKKTISVCK